MKDIDQPLADEDTQESAALPAKGDFWPKAAVSFKKAKVNKKVRSSDVAGPPTPEPETQKEEKPFYDPETNKYSNNGKSLIGHFGNAVRVVSSGVNPIQAEGLGKQAGNDIARSVASGDVFQAYGYVDHLEDGAKDFFDRGLISGDEYERVKLEIGNVKEILDDEFGTYGEAFALSGWETTKDLYGSFTKYLGHVKASGSLFGGIVYSKAIEAEINAIENLEKEIISTDDKKQKEQLEKEYTKRLERFKNNHPKEAKELGALEDKDRRIFGSGIFLEEMIEQWKGGNILTGLERGVQGIPLYLAESAPYLPLYFASGKLVFGGIGALARTASATQAGKAIAGYSSAIKASILNAASKAPLGKAGKWLGKKADKAAANAAAKRKAKDAQNIYKRMNEDGFLGKDIIKQLNKRQKDMIGKAAIGATRVGAGLSLGYGLAKHELYEAGQEAGQKHLKETGRLLSPDAMDSAAAEFFSGLEVASQMWPVFGFLRRLGLSDEAAGQVIKTTSQKISDIAGNIGLTGVEEAVQEVIAETITQGVVADIMGREGFDIDTPEKAQEFFDRLVMAGFAGFSSGATLAGAGTVIKGSINRYRNKPEEEAETGDDGDGTPDETAEPEPEPEPEPDIAEPEPEPDIAEPEPEPDIAEPEADIAEPEADGKPPVDDDSDDGDGGAPVAEETAEQVDDDITDSADAKSIPQNESDNYAEPDVSRIFIDAIDEEQEDAAIAMSELQSNLHRDFFNKNEVDGVLSVFSRQGYVLLRNKLDSKPANVVVFEPKSNNITIGKIHIPNNQDPNTSEIFIDTGGLHSRSAVGRSNLKDFPGAEIYMINNIDAFVNNVELMVTGREGDGQLGISEGVNELSGIFGRYDGQDLVDEGENLKSELTELAGKTANKDFAGILNNISKGVDAAVRASELTNDISLSLSEKRSSEGDSDTSSVYLKHNNIDVVVSETFDNDSKTGLYSFVLGNTDRNSKGDITNELTGLALDSGVLEESNFTYDRQVKQLSVASGHLYKLARAIDYLSTGTQANKLNALRAKDPITQGGIDGSVEPVDDDSDSGDDGDGGALVDGENAKPEGAENTEASADTENTQDQDANEEQDDYDIEDFDDVAEIDLLEQQQREDDEEKAKEEIQARKMDKKHRKKIERGKKAKEELGEENKRILERGFMVAVYDYLKSKGLKSRRAFASASLIAERIQGRVKDVLAPNEGKIAESISTSGKYVEDSYGHYVAGLATFIALVKGGYLNYASLSESVELILPYINNRHGVSLRPYALLSEEVNEKALLELIVSLSNEFAEIVNDYFPADDEFAPDLYGTKRNLPEAVSAGFNATYRYVSVRLGDLIKGRDMNWHTKTKEERLELLKRRFKNNKEISLEIESSTEQAEVTDKSKMHLDNTRKPYKSISSYVFKFSANRKEKPEEGAKKDDTDQDYEKQNAAADVAFSILEQGIHAINLMNGWVDSQGVDMKIDRDNWTIEISSDVDVLAEMYAISELFTEMAYEYRTKFYLSNHTAEKNDANEAEALTKEQQKEVDDYAKVLNNETDGNLADILGGEIKPDETTDNNTSSFSIDGGKTTIKAMSVSNKKSQLDRLIDVIGDQETTYHATANQFFLSSPSDWNIVIDRLKMYLFQNKDNAHIPDVQETLRDVAQIYGAVNDHLDSINKKKKASLLDLIIEEYNEHKQEDSSKVDSGMVNVSFNTNGTISVSVDSKGKKNKKAKDFISEARAMLTSPYVSIDNAQVYGGGNLLEIKIMSVQDVGKDAFEGMLKDSVLSYRARKRQRELENNAKEAEFSQRHDLVVDTDNKDVDILHKDVAEHIQQGVIDAAREEEQLHDISIIATRYREALDSRGANADAIKNLKDELTQLESAKDPDKDRIEVVQRNLSNLVRRGTVITSGTGTGKTFVIGGFMAHALRTNPNAKIILITKNETLVEDALEANEPILKGYENRVTVTTYSSLAKAVKPDDVTEDHIIIADESHEIKNLLGKTPSKTAKKVSNLIVRSGFSVMASATPFKNFHEVEYLKRAGVYNDITVYRRDIEKFKADYLKDVDASKLADKSSDESILYGVIERLLDDVIGETKDSDGNVKKNEQGKIENYNELVGIFNYVQIANASGETIDHSRLPIRERHGYLLAYVLGKSGNLIYRKQKFGHAIFSSLLPILLRPEIRQLLLRLGTAKKGVRDIVKYYTSKDGGGYTFPKGFFRNVGSVALQIERRIIEFNKVKRVVEEASETLAKDPKAKLVLFVETLASLDTNKLKVGDKWKEDEEVKRNSLRRTIKGKSDLSKEEQKNVIDAFVEWGRDYEVVKEHLNLTPDNLLINSDEVYNDVALIFGGIIPHNRLEDYTGLKLTQDDYNRGALAYRKLRLARINAINREGGLPLDMMEHLFDVFTYDERDLTELTLPMSLSTLMLRKSMSHDGLNIKQGDIMESYKTGLENAGIKTVSFQGETPSQERRRVIDMFNEDNDNAQAIIATAGSGSTGVSLHDKHGGRQRNTLVVNVPLNTIDFAQLLGRTYRAGMKSDVNIEMVVSVNSQEDLVRSNSILQTVRNMMENAGASNYAADATDQAIGRAQTVNETDPTLRDMAAPAITLDESIKPDAGLPQDIEMMISLFRRVAPNVPLVLDASGSASAKSPTLAYFLTTEDRKGYERNSFVINILSSMAYQMSLKKGKAGIDLMEHQENRDYILSSIASHEIFHHVYKSMASKDRVTLQQAARDGKWLDKFKIRERYPNIDADGKLEESIAEAFRVYSASVSFGIGHRLGDKSQKTIDIDGNEVPLWQIVFDKIIDLLNAITNFLLLRGEEVKPVFRRLREQSDNEVNQLFGDILSGNYGDLRKKKHDNKLNLQTVRLEGEGEQAKKVNLVLKDFLDRKNGIKTNGRPSKALNSLRDFWKSIGKHFIHLKDNQHNALFLKEANTVKAKLSNVFNQSIIEYETALGRQFDALAPYEQELVSSFLFLRDLQYDAEQGKSLPVIKEGKETTKEDVDNMLSEASVKMYEHLEETPDSLVNEFILEHDGYMDELRRRLVNSGAYTANQLDNRYYMKHIVTDYLHGEKTGKGRGDISKAKVYRREGTELPLLMDYRVVMKASILDANARIIVADFHGWLKKSKYNLTGQLIKEAKRQNELIAVSNLLGKLKGERYYERLAVRGIGAGAARGDMSSFLNGFSELKIKTEDIGIYELQELMQIRKNLTWTKDVIVQLAYEELILLKQGHSYSRVELLKALQTLSNGWQGDLPNDLFRALKYVLTENDYKFNSGIKSVVAIYMDNITKRTEAIRKLAGEKYIPYNNKQNLVEQLIDNLTINGESAELGFYNADSPFGGKMLLGKEKYINRAAMEDIFNDPAAFMAFLKEPENEGLLATITGSIAIGDKEKASKRLAKKMVERFGEDSVFQFFGFDVGMVMPKDIADTLNNFFIEPFDIPGGDAVSLASAELRKALLLPWWSVIEYALNNTMTDFQAIAFSGVLGNPKATRIIRESSKEAADFLFRNIESSEIKEMLKYGTLTTAHTAGDLLLHEGVDPAELGIDVDSWGWRAKEAYYNTMRKGVDFMAVATQLALYKHYENRILEGDRPQSIGVNLLKREVMQELVADYDKAENPEDRNVEEMAAKMTQATYGDYLNTSAFIQQYRRTILLFVTFLATIVTKAKNNARNILPDTIDAYRAEGGAGATWHLVKNTAYLPLSIYLAYAIKQGILSDEEEENLPSYNQFRVPLPMPGTNSHHFIETVGVEYLRFFNINYILEKMKRLEAQGREYPIDDLFLDMARGLPNTAYNYINPIFKAPLEMMAGVTLFPELKPKPIHDKSAHFLRTLRLDWVSDFFNSPEVASIDSMYDVLNYAYDNLTDPDTYANIFFNPKKLSGGRGAFNAVKNFEKNMNQRTVFYGEQPETTDGRRLTYNIFRFIIDNPDALTDETDRVLENAAKRIAYENAKAGREGRDIATYKEMKNGMLLRARRYFNLDKRLLEWAENSDGITREQVDKAKKWRRYHIKPQADRFLEHYRNYIREARESARQGLEREAA